MTVIVHWCPIYSPPSQMHAASCQTELEEARKQLAERDQDLDDLTANLKEKDIRIKEMEIELLTANQRQLAGDGEHAQEMRDMAEKLDQCKVSVWSL